METDLAVGASFLTYDDFEVSFTRYKKRTNTVFVKADSKTVAAENKKLKDTIAPYPSEHRFRYVRFNCKHFGDNKHIFLFSAATVSVFNRPPPLHNTPHVPLTIVSDLVVRGA